MGGKQFCFRFGIFWMTQILCFAYDLEWPSEKDYDVIIGEQQTVIVPYNLTNGSLHKTAEKIRIDGPTGAEFKSYYNIRNETANAGKLYLHFLQVHQKDIGIYTLFVSNSWHIIFIRGIPPPNDVYKLLLYILPALFFVVACVAIVVAVVTVRRNRGNFDSATKVKKVKKNPYVKSGAGFPARSSTSLTRSSESQLPSDVPHVNTVSRNDSPPPPVISTRTTSLHPVNQHDARTLTSPAVQFCRQDLNRQSMNSLDSFDDVEDEYENTCHEAFPSTQQQLARSFCNNPPVNKQASHHADSSSYLSSKPMSPPFNKNMQNLKKAYQPTAQRFPNPNKNQVNVEFRNICSDVMPSNQQWPVQKYPPHPISSKPNNNLSRLQVSDDIYDQVS